MSELRLQTAPNAPFHTGFSSRHPNISHVVYSLPQFALPVFSIIYHQVAAGDCTFLCLVLFITICLLTEDCLHVGVLSAIV